MAVQPDPRRTGIRAAVEWAQIDGGEYASRQGRGVCGWVNEAVPGAAQIVLNTGSLTYNIPEGRRIMVGQYCYAVESINDDCQFEFGWTTAVDGGGTFFPVGPHKHVYTGAANTGRTSFDQDIKPAARISYAAGARCITFRVNANDGAAVITVGWHGWWEEDS